MAQNPVKFSLAEALSSYDAGVVADAIEKYGCFGLDQYGRFQESDEGVKAEALNLVKEYYKNWMIEKELDEMDQPSSISDYEGKYGIFAHNGSRPEFSYGWYKDNLPPMFNAGYVPESAEKVEKPITTSESNDLPPKWRKAFEYESEGLNALYDLIEQHFFDADGHPIYDLDKWPLKKNLSSEWLTTRTLKEADTIITSGKRKGAAKK